MNIFCLFIVVSCILCDSHGAKKGKQLKKNYMECLKGKCLPKTDREIHWIFDQPDPLYINQEIEMELAEGHRINIKFRSATSSRPEADNSTVPKQIHMTWLGSPLPLQRFAPNIKSYISLNPDYVLYLWLDHADRVPLSWRSINNLVIKDVSQEKWDTKDLLDQSTNWAMMSDIIRWEIMFKYGGIYVDVDSTALRGFGPIFTKSFLSYRRKNWAKGTWMKGLLSKDTDLGTAGLATNVFGFPRQSNFVEYLIKCLRENFPTVAATLDKTGPSFVKEAFLQYPFNRNIVLISNDYLNADQDPDPNTIIFDSPDDSMWNDKQDVRKLKHKPTVSVTIDLQKNKWNKMLS